MVKAPECRPKVSQGPKEPEEAPPPQQAPPHPSTLGAQYWRRWMLTPEQTGRGAAQAPPPPAAPEPDLDNEIHRQMHTPEEMRRAAQQAPPRQQAPPPLTAEQQRAREVELVLQMHRVFERTPGRQQPMWDAQAPPPQAPPILPLPPQDLRQLGEGNFVIMNGQTYTWAEYENRRNARGQQ